MNRKELARSAINHVETNEVPYCIYFTTAALEKYKDMLYSDFLDSELKSAVREGLLCPREAVSVGMGNHVVALTLPWWGWYDLPREYYASPQPPPYLPRSIGAGSYTELDQKIKYLASKDCYILGVIYGSHFEKANFCRGIENFLADLAGEPEYSQKLLGHIIRKNIVMLENAVSFGGLDGILLGSDWGSQQSMLMSPKTWRELIAPGEAKEYEVIKSAGKDLWIHSCGNIEAIIPDLAEMGVDVLNPMQPEVMDIYDIKKRFGHKLCFWGGITTQRVLPYGTPSDVAAETGKVIGEMSLGGGYITAPSQDFQADVSYENCMALLEEARSYRRMAPSSLKERTL
jgi:hypothetical protein